MAYPIKLEKIEFVGGFDKKTYRVWRPQQGTDQIVGIKWVGDRIPETWQSKPLGKDVLDFTFLQNPDRILVLYRDGAGYALEAFQ